MFYYIILLPILILLYRYNKIIDNQNILIKNLNKIIINQNHYISTKNDKIMILEKAKLTDLEKAKLTDLEKADKIMVLEKQLLDQTELTDKIMVLETINKNMNTSIIQLYNLCNNKNELFKNNLKIINYYIERVYILEHNK